MNDNVGNCRIDLTAIKLPFSKSVSFWNIPVVVGIVAFLDCLPKSDEKLFERKKIFFAILDVGYLQ